MDSITPTALVQDIDDVILLDCRSFWSYKEKHILNAINVNCSSAFVRRRLKLQRMSVANLIHHQEDKSSFAARSAKTMVVYNDYGLKTIDGCQDDPLVLVLRNLKQEGSRARVLTGGLKGFERLFPNLCVTNMGMSTQ